MEIQKINLITLAVEPEQFSQQEKGVDCSFFGLPSEAQDLANHFILECNGVNDLVRTLDTSIEFRAAIDCLDFDVYPREVDSVIRYYRHLQEVSKQ